MDSYGKLSTQFYDIDKPHAPPQALEFYLHYAREAQGKLLEPMCGSGRFLIPLLQRGFEVIGTDASPHMLAACRQQARCLGLKPVLYEQYIHKLAVPGVFQLVMIPAGSFCLITDKEQAVTSLNKIFDHMAPGAKLIVEIDQRIDRQIDELPEDNPDESAVIRSDGAKIRMNSSGDFDPSEGVYRGINRYDLVKDGQVLETEWERFNLRYYAPQVFSQMLEKVGFHQIHHHSAYDTNQPEEISESLVFIASKRT